MYLKEEEKQTLKDISDVGGKIVVDRNTSTKEPINGDMPVANVEPNIEHENPRVIISLNNSGFLSSRLISETRYNEVREFWLTYEGQRVLCKYFPEEDDK